MLKSTYTQYGRAMQKCMDKSIVLKKSGTLKCQSEWKAVFKSAVTRRA